VIEAALGPFEFSATGDRIEVPSNAAARLAAVNGSGVAIVPLDLVAADLADRRLSRLECTDVDLDQPIRLAWKGTRPTSRAARRLHGFLA
jgi:DNA-binding transcriptional LysR family regulator